MNKYVLIGVGVVAIVTIIFASKILIKKVDNSSKQLELTYEINAGIPFRWEFEIEDDSIVEFKKSYVIRDDNKGGLVGGKIVTNYVFVGKKEGVTKVTFKYVNFTDDNYPTKEEVHKIKVDKDKNISLVGISE
jgi:hypothetical protein